MQKFKQLPPLEMIREWLDYDPESGLVRWKKRHGRGRNLIGQIAGTKNRKSGIAVKFLHYGFFMLHRLIWVLEVGPIPEGLEIDHEDGDSRNNRLVNLRLATSSQQKMNRGVQSNNRSGLKGAYYHDRPFKKKWRSQIKVGNRLIFLGYFMTAEEAHAAHTLASKENFGAFHRQERIDAGLIPSEAKP